jgi:hypothetical protein
MEGLRVQFPFGSHFLALWNINLWLLSDREQYFSRCIWDCESLSTLINNS